MKKSKGIDLRMQKRSGVVTFDDIAAGAVPYQSPLLFGVFQHNNYLTLSAVFAALDIISSAIALMPITVRQYSEDKSETVDSRLPLLFEESIPSKFILMKALVWDVLWHGNGYAYIQRNRSGQPTGIVYLQHGDVTVTYDKLKGEVTYGVTNHQDIPTSNIPKKDMLHFLKNTRDGVTGIGILAFAGPSFELSDSLTTAAEDHFSSGCGISGILKFHGAVPEKSKAEIRSQWAQIHGTGAPGSGLAIASADCDFIPVQQDPNSSQMLESRKFSIEEISRFFGINPILLGYMDAGAWSNIEEISIQFVQYTLLPIVNMIESELTRKLLPDVYDMHFDLDEHVLLKANKQAQASYLNTLTQGGIMTINEARRMLDLNPVDGGDKLLIPYSDIAQNTVNQDVKSDDNASQDE